MAVDAGLLVLRVVVGALLFGHGTQKLFGWFGGHGLRGTAWWLGSLGFRPAGLWALLAGLGEAGGGLLLALGLLHPLGSLGVIAAMLMAIVRVHWSKGLWNSDGGAELPLAYLVVAAVVGLVGPGAYALDRMLGLTLPLSASLIFWGGLVVVVIVDGIGLLVSTSHVAAEQRAA